MIREKWLETVIIRADATVSAVIDLAESFDSKIAFVSTRDGVSNIFVMNADGSNPVNVTPGSHATAPALSPIHQKVNNLKSIRRLTIQPRVLSLDIPPNFTTDEGL